MIKYWSNIISKRLKNYKYQYVRVLGTFFQLPNKIPDPDAETELPEESSWRWTEDVFDGGDKAMTFPGPGFKACKARNWSELLSLSILYLIFFEDNFWKTNEDQNVDNIKNIPLFEG